MDSLGANDVPTYTRHAEARHRLFEQSGEAERNGRLDDALTCMNKTKDYGYYPPHLETAVGWYEAMVNARISKLILMQADAWPSKHVEHMATTVGALEAQKLFLMLDDSMLPPEDLSKAVEWFKSQINDRIRLLSDDSWPSIANHGQFRESLLLHSDGALASRLENSAKTNQRRIAKMRWEMVMRDPWDTKKLA